MNYRSKRNEEQLLGMYDLLVLFKNGKISLYRLVSSLMGKRAGMINIDNEWNSSFESLWLELEMYNALILNANERGEEAKFDKEINTAVQNIELFVRDAAKI